MLATCLVYCHDRVLLLASVPKSSVTSFAVDPKAARQPSVYPARLVFRQRVKAAKQSLSQAQRTRLMCLVRLQTSQARPVAELLLGVPPPLLLLLLPQLLHSTSSKLRGLMVSTRQKFASICWLQSMQQAARLPDGVVMHILDCCCQAACLDGIDPQQWSMGSCSSTFADLDRLRRVSAAFNQRISHNADFLQLLCCEKLRAFERKTWGKKGRISQKKLPASFTLPSLTPWSGNSAHSISHARLHLLKTPKSPQHFQVEARHSDSSPSQVLQLLQLMCHLEGRITGMLYIIAWRRSSSPKEWVDQIAAGAKNITHPVPVRMFEREEWAGLYPDNKQFVTRLAPRA